jgi:hypothetical protein
MTPLTAQPCQPKHLLSCDEILRIARQDGEMAYRHLTPYRISLNLREDGWHVDFDLTDPLVAGGGPHYIINPDNGLIVWKRYEQ